MTGLTFVLVALSTWRFTLLATTDTISDPLRRAVKRTFKPHTVPLVSDGGDVVPGAGTLKPHPLVELLSCDWCLSPWWAAAVVVVVCRTGVASVPLPVLWVPACSAIAGALSDIIG